MGKEAHASTPEASCLGTGRERAKGGALPLCRRCRRESSSPPCGHLCEFGLVRGEGLGDEVHARIHALVHDGLGEELHVEDTASPLVVREAAAARVVEA